MNPTSLPTQQPQKLPPEQCFSLQYKWLNIDVERIKQEHKAWIKYQNRTVQARMCGSICYAIINVVAVVAIQILMQYHMISPKIGSAALVGVHGLRVLSSIGNILHLQMLMHQDKKGITFKIDPPHVAHVEESMNQFFSGIYSLCLEVPCLIMSSVAVAITSLRTIQGLCYSGLALTILSSIITCIAKYKFPETQIKPLKEEEVRSRDQSVTEVLYDRLDNTNLNVKQIDKCQSLEEMKKLLTAKKLACLIPYLKEEYVEADIAL